MQPGGEKHAHGMLKDFLNVREVYHQHISMPEDEASMLSIESIFGLGQYINQAVYQSVLQQKQVKKRSSNGRRRKTMGACPFCINFRLHWHCHFIRAKRTQYGEWRPAEPCPVGTALLLTA